MRSFPRDSGFTLLELAIVLLILGLLIGGLLIPLATQVEQRDRRSVNEQLEQIKQALLGYAIINERLPCPTFETDPSSVDYGIPVAPGDSGCDEEGILPWKVLGIPEADPWGSPRTASGDSWRGYWRYRVDVNFTGDGASKFTLDTTPDENLEVKKDISGTLVRLTPSPASSPDDTPVFIAYSTGPDQERSGLNVPDASDSDEKEYQGGTLIKDDFDDIIVWMTRPMLLSTMLSAKKLPSP